MPAVTDKPAPGKLLASGPQTVACERSGGRVVNAVRSPLLRLPPVQATSAAVDL